LVAKNEIYYQNLDEIEQKLTKNNLVIYINKNARPRWYALVDNQYIPGSVKPSLISPSRVVMEVSLDSPSRVVFADTDYPGWVAYVDGRKVDIEKYENILKSVVVPAGSHSVEFAFRSRSFALGVLFTLTGVILLSKKSKRHSQG
jgi:uncharacterized membrane protein YfhO